MRIGLISDIHASRRSLERAFDLMAGRGAERIACMGDMVQTGADGDAVVALLQDAFVICVSGNHDANAVRRAREEGDSTLSEASVAWLAALPSERAYEWDGLRVAIAHQAPGGIDAYVWPDDIPRSLKRARRNAAYDVALLGHTHVPMKVRYLDTWLINPGSVRGTRTRDSHTCAVLELPSLELEVISLDQ